MHAVCFCSVVHGVPVSIVQDCVRQEARIVAEFCTTPTPYLYHLQNVLHT